MFSLTSLLTFTTLLSAAVSFPFPFVSRAAHKEYRLQTRIVNNKNDTGSFKGKLWVTAYHTGAGFNDAVLLPNKTSASKAYFNGTELLFDLGTQFPWYMVMTDIDYAAWDMVQINAFDGVTGFSINSTGLQWNETEFGFAGWLACDWYHGLPQLFYLSEFYPYYTYPIPTSCSKVDLIPVLV